LQVSEQQARVALLLGLCWVPQISLGKFLKLLHNINRLNALPSSELTVTKL